MNIREYGPTQYIASKLEQYDLLRGTIFTNILAITLLLYINAYVMPKAFIYIYKYLLYFSGILYYFKYSHLNWRNIHCISIVVISMQIQGYTLHDYFPLKLIGKYLLLYNKSDLLDIYHKYVD